MLWDASSSIILSGRAWFRVELPKDVETGIMRIVRGIDERLARRPKLAFGGDLFVLVEVRVPTDHREQFATGGSIAFISPAPVESLSLRD